MRKRQGGCGGRRPICKVHLPINKSRFNGFSEWWGTMQRCHPLPDKSHLDPNRWRKSSHRTRQLFKTHHSESMRGRWPKPIIKVISIYVCYFFQAVVIPMAQWACVECYFWNVISQSHAYYLTVVFFVIIYLSVQTAHSLTSPQWMHFRSSVRYKYINETEMLQIICW